MSSKFLNVALAVLLSTGVLSEAKANLIVGEVYNDTAGLQWQYVGYFDLAAGPYWNDADGNMNDGDRVKPINGLEAATELFGLPMEELALSSYVLGYNFSSISIGANTVNHLAWYDGNINAISRLAENRDADVDNDGSYDQFDPAAAAVNRDVSAYVSDRAGRPYDPSPTANNAINDFYINYVFKAVAVTEPSTLAIYTLALFGLGMRRLKKI